MYILLSYCKSGKVQCSPPEFAAIASYTTEMQYKLISWRKIYYLKHDL